jgi:hypothetical protein
MEYETMYATITELTFHDPQSLLQATCNLEDLVAEARNLPGFRALCVVQTETNAAAMVTLYDSEADLESGSAKLRPRLAEAIGPLVSGNPRRVAGTVLLST